MTKKKQKRIALITLAVLFGFSGCGNIGAPKGYEDYTIKKEQYVDEYTERYDYWDVVTVEYPVLSGMDEEQAETVNKTLYDIAMEKVNYWHLTPNEEVKALQEEYSSYSSDVHCDINFHSQYLLSAAFYETYAPISPVFYVQITERCANINLMTGEQYQLSDIFQMNGGFIEAWCKQVEADGTYDNLIVNDADTRETLGAWFLGEDEEAGEYYMFTPFFYIDENKDFVIGFSYDPKPNRLGMGGNLPEDNSFYAHFAAADLEAYRTDSAFWELYEQSEITGNVIEKEDLRENIWMGENASVWGYWDGAKDNNENGDVCRNIDNWKNWKLYGSTSGRESYRMRYDVPLQEQENYTVLIEDLGEYEVCEGDSLWSISEKLLENGGSYMQVAKQNADVIQNPDLIYQGMSLQMRQNVYVKKRTGVNGIKTPEYRLGTPDEWVFGILEEGEAFSNNAFFARGADGSVACLLRDKEEAGVKSLSDWEHCQKQIADYVEKHYKKQVSDLTFHKYQSESGADIYLFSYCYTIDGAQYGYRGSITVHASEAVCQTEHFQAELTGFQLEEGIEDIVLYMAGSFEEFAGTDGKDFSVSGYNIMLTPSEPWAVAGIHNPFVWVETYYDGILSRLSTLPPKKNARGRILYR